MNKAKKLISLAAAITVFMSGCGNDFAGSTNEGYSETAAAENIKTAAKNETKNSYNFKKLEYSGIKKTDFNVLIEAENAEQTSGISVKTDKSGYSGKGYIDITDNKGFGMSVDIPASQYYKITVRHCAGSHKENPLLFNGLKAMDIYSEDGDWVETAVDGIFLEKGTNKITLGNGWSWFSLDCIRIENGEPISDDIYKNPAETLSNPNANRKTKNIYQYLRDIYGKRTLSGQCTNYGTNTETDALYLGLGKYPAVRTFDFIYDSMSFCKNKPSAKDVSLAVDWSNDGGLVAFDWHWYAPYNECEFYTEKTSFRLANAVTDEKIALMKHSEVQKLYDSGKISIETLKIIEDIDNISALMQQMEDKNVTVMWRSVLYTLSIP